MNDGELWVLTTTFPQREEAERVCALLVDAGLAACAQVGAEIGAFYRWEGEVRRDAEVPVVLKVLKDRYDLCVGELKLQHPYDVPQLVGWPAARADDAYLAWARGGSR